MEAQVLSPLAESTSIEFGEFGPDASALGASTLVVADLLNNGGQTILVEGDDVSPADLATTPLSARLGTSLNIRRSGDLTQA
jgi:hypothetical protein